MLDLPYSYTTLVLGTVALEFLRRLLKALIVGFTGPLSKVPGPFWNKLSPLPWRLAFLKGTAPFLAQKLHRKYGDVVRVTPNLVLVSDPVSVHKILVQWDLHKSPLYEKYRQNPHVATLFTERDKAKYRVRRRLLSNGFSMSYLKALEPLMHDCVQVLEDVLEERCSAGGGTAVVNIYDLLSSLASDIMAECSFGGSFGLVRQGHHPLKTRITNFMKKAALYQTIPFLSLFGKPRDDQLNAIVDGIINKRLNSQKVGGRKDLLDMLLEASAENPNQLSMQDIKAEMLVFLLAGSDTSAVTATFCLMKLLENPTTYQALKKELDELISSPSDPIVDDNTRDLPYLNAVIYETLRMLPPAAGGFARQALEPVIVGDYALPAGTLVTADTTALHRDSRIWPDADSYVPERWITGHKGEKALERNWYPFSAGSRICIGKHFALKEVRLILAVLLRRFELSIVPDQKIEYRHHSVLYIASGEYLMTEQSKPFRVAVIGGGIAGLLLGQLLSSSPGIDAHVYERYENEDSLSGYRIQLSLEITKLLQTHLPPDTWAKVLPSIGKTPKEGYYHSCFMRPDGHIFYTYLPDEFRQTAAVSRIRLRKGLLHASENWLTTGKAFTAYEKLQDGTIKANFADGTSHVCDLIVGADGIASRVRHGLLPHIQTVQTDLVIVYFKVPYTREVESMIPYKTGSLVLYPNGQEITIVTWQNPEQPYAKGLDPEHIDPETSYVMVGFGGRLKDFADQSKSPAEMSPQELKAECISRVNAHPTHPSIRALAELIVTDSAYANVFRMVDVAEPWDSGQITLVGDAMFNMAPFLGKGAACAMEDAVDIGRIIMRFPETTVEKRRLILRQCVDKMRQRRLKERQRSAFVMNLCFFGTTPFRAALRDYGMEIANVWLTASGLARITILFVSIGVLVAGVWGLNGEFFEKLAEGVRQLLAAR
ncbi:hypothetical protein FSARC_11981 [Fusarium sarcochroum]|uniref:FAD-binding domain-containing protein n=1 Tax=Fusarium sarcochroum TaxID=1208366 RepID=A0A8H4TBL5_9HYPO|nr:hypothetical protein FSARC_11981 [Fusarium sarcochroum]